MVSRIYIAVLLTCILSLVLVEPGRKKPLHGPPRLRQTNRDSPEQQLMERYKSNQEACLKFGTSPYFDPKLVLGPQWRFYYTWNLRKKYNCLAMKFYETNYSIMSRFYRDMGQYLAEQPMWNEAILYMTIGAARHEMLLLAAFGPPGRIDGVPNLMRDPNFIQRKRNMSVPLMQYQMKLLQGGKYLVILDCLAGVASLSVRDSDAPPDPKKMKEVATSLGIGNGALACPLVTTTTTTTTEGTDYENTHMDYSTEPISIKVTTEGNKTT